MSDAQAEAPLPPKRAPAEDPDKENAPDEDDKSRKRHEVKIKSLFSKAESKVFEEECDEIEMDEAAQKKLTSNDDLDGEKRGDKAEARSSLQAS